MAGTHLSIRIDLPSGGRIGPGKIALLEVIRSTGSISGAARSIGMSYRLAWLLVEEINQTLREPAVTAYTGGARGGGAVVTPVGEVVGLDRAIETQARSAAGNEFRGHRPAHPARRQKRLESAPQTRRADMTAAVTVTDDGAVRVIRLNRSEKKNALTIAMYAEVARALREADGNEAIRCGVIAGAPGAFRAGNDITDFLGAASGRRP